MDRRSFIQNVAAVGGISIAAGGPRETRSVSYGVDGFTCVTCAVGLETMLRKQAGVVRASASYAEKRCEIGFDAALTSEDSLRRFIADCGFGVR